MKFSGKVASDLSFLPKFSLIIECEMDFKYWLVRLIQTSARYSEGNFGGNYLLDSLISRSPLGFARQNCRFVIRTDADLHQSFPWLRAIREWIKKKLWGPGLVSISGVRRPVKFDFSLWTWVVHSEHKCGRQKCGLKYYAHLLGILVDYISLLTDACPACCSNLLLITTVERK